jgi:spermidine synthase
MKPYEQIDRHETPAGQVLKFMHHDGDYFILIDEEELMATRAVHSESELARLTCSDLKMPEPRVLIGGLGLGFTMKAALDVLPASAEVVVAEKFECVVRWNHEHVPKLQGDALRDPRLVIAQGDVWDSLSGPNAAFDVIMLDVDNGPNATCFDVNARLYSRRGLARLQGALRPGGLLAIWATDPDKPFERRLRQSGFEAKTEMVRSRGERGARHYLFMARMRSGGDAKAAEPRLRKARRPKGGAGRRR